MKMVIQKTVKLLSVLAIALLASVGIADQNTADHYSLAKGDSFSWDSDVISAQFENAIEETDSFKLMLFRSVPIKSIQVSAPTVDSVTLCGTPFGIRMFTNGVMVVDTAGIVTQEGVKSPALDAGIQDGDIILSLDDVPVSQNEEIAEYVEAGGGKPIAVSLLRDEEKLDLVLVPVFSKTDQAYKAGIWVRDSTAGIGTLTYYDENTGFFGGLGHGICDADTCELMPLRTGDVMPVTINGITKGERGNPGALRGYFTNDIARGKIFSNTRFGVYGKLSAVPNGLNVQIGFKQTVKIGRIQIYSTIDDTGPEYYDAQIESINYHGDEDGRNFVIRITDPELLEKTGGIVQGMSGSPVLQNGKLVGAVTHVLVNDPTRGYGIFIENMLGAVG